MLLEQLAVALGVDLQALKQIASTTDQQPESYGDAVTGKPMFGVASELIGRGDRSSVSHLMTQGKVPHTVIDEVSLAGPIRRGSNTDRAIDGSVGQVTAVPTDVEKQSQSPPKLPELPAAGGPSATPAATSTAQPAHVVAQSVDLAGQDDVASKLSVSPTEPKQADRTGASQPAAPLLTPGERVTADNLDRVVTAVRTNLLPGGGHMQIQLDPPELGALAVSVRVVDGRMTAIFTAANEEASQMLSHSLGQLKSSLETSGVAVDRIQVRTATADSGASTSSDPRDPGRDSQQQHAWHQSDQQRRDQLNRMWQRAMVGEDEVDLLI